MLPFLIFNLDQRGYELPALRGHLNELLAEHAGRGAEVAAAYVELAQRASGPSA